MKHLILKNLFLLILIVTYLNVKSFMKYTNKYKNKNHLIKNKNKMKSSILHFGNIGLISLENKYLNSKELESCKRNILKRIKSKGTLVVKVNPFLGITAKPLATRMGKGKGMIDY